MTTRCLMGVVVAPAGSGPSAALASGDPDEIPASAAAPSTAPARVALLSLDTSPDPPRIDSAQGNGREGYARRVNATTLSGNDRANSKRRERYRPGRVLSRAPCQIQICLPWESDAQPRSLQHRRENWRSSPASWGSGLAERADGSSGDQSSPVAGKGIDGELACARAARRTAVLSSTTAPTMASRARANMPSAISAGRPLAPRDAPTAATARLGHAAGTSVPWVSSGKPPPAVAHWTPISFSAGLDSGLRSLTSFQAHHITPPHQDWRAKVSRSAR